MPFIRAHVGRASRRLRRPAHRARLPRRQSLGHDGVVTEESDTRWSGYYSATSSRKPRPMLIAACERLGDGAGRVAVDLGSGAGVEALALLAHGWSVVAVDADPAGLEMLSEQVPPARKEHISLVCADFTDIDLPPAHLIHAGYSLPFSAPPKFPALWKRIRHALVPGGIFAGQLFGIHDSWAYSPDMTFQDRPEVMSLLDGLEVLTLQESEYDGEAVSGPKHWHLFDILARQPGEG